VHAVLIPAIPEIRSYTPLECYFGYGAWQDLSARCFAGFLIHDVLNLLMYYPLNQLPNRLMLLHHVIFLTIVTYAIQGSYFRCGARFPCVMPLS
jgi:hypothetical protein